MITKYGKIPDPIWVDYKAKLINKIYKILPMKEEEYSTLDVYIESLIYEVVGDNKLMDSVQNHGEFITILGILENLIEEKDLAIVKREVFKCLDIIKKIK